MASELPVQTILNIGDLSSVLSSVANQKNTLFKGATLDPMLPRTIARVKRSLALQFSANPSGQTIRSVAEYLLQLCGPFALQSQTVLNNLSGSLPAITGPANQTGLVGFTAVFSVSVASATTVFYQWYRDGILISGATNSSYTLTNAQLSDSGSTFFVTATNSAGQQVSSTATLTVTASIVGFLYYNASDPGPTLQGGDDPFTYQQSYTITHNASISVPIPSGATPNMYLVFKIPDTESAKNTWFSTVLNNGSIPDSVFQSPTTFGGFTYYYTRVAATFDSPTPLILSAV